MIDLEKIYHRGAETQRKHREMRQTRFSLRHLRASVSLWWILAFLFAAPIMAKEAAPLAQDEAAEKRLTAISSELRCLVCQNESLAGSNAELAQDLRREIRGMIQSGKSDGEIMDFMVSRYGDFVRYRPPLKGTTLFLWFGPALLFAGGLGGLFIFLRRRTRAIKDVPLSAAERKQAERLLASQEKTP